MTSLTRLPGSKRNYIMTSTTLPETPLDEKNQVRVLKGPEVPPLQWPHYSDTGSTFAPPHCSYHSLGHCLRTNIFPGVPVVWTSMVKESYVTHPCPAPPTGPEHWHGRKTDDMSGYGWECLGGEMDGEEH
ncbi:hypothetical protein DPEC_G00275330 [Dallia pectoralis]|uniref:Uncharacterized protein n=1 Tax=Dallia pectoralis TaxID=75939 RepID=A0ACC2FLA0_DALPE|nr:hypothetical protein DPEC_G00275330 [Dallia pectoralis]